MKNQKNQKKTLQQIDTDRFLTRLRERVLKDKVVNITLRPKGNVTVAMIRTAMGNSIAVEETSEGLKIGVKNET